MVTRSCLKTECQYPRKNASENECNFYYLWKQYLARFGGVKDSQEEAKVLTDQVNGVMGDDDDDEAAAAAPAAAAPVEGGNASDDGGVA